jgi:hypothetical protein
LSESSEAQWSEMAVPVLGGPAPHSADAQPSEKR